MSKKPISVLLTALALILSLASLARAEPVQLPITMDYDLLRSLFIYQVYTSSGQRAVALDADEGCSKIELWEPELGPEGNYIRLGSRIKVRAGLSLGGQCRQPVDWEGFIEVVQRVWIEPGTWTLRFETMDSRLFNKNRERSKVSKVLWDLVKSHLHDYLDRTRIGLSPPVEEIKGLLPLVFAPEEQPKVRRWIDSLAPGPIRVGPEAVQVFLKMEVETPPPAGPTGPEKALSAQEMDRLTQVWEVWDAYLLSGLQSLVGKPLTREEKGVIFDTVLQTRHHFNQALMSRQPDRDLVRQQFIFAWQRLAPIFRKHLTSSPSASLISYLAFFSASDALAALDKLGPTLGLEISRNGLIRLARLIASGEKAPVLDYTFEVDEDLREVMGLGPAPEESGPALEEESLEMEPDQGPLSGSWLEWLLPSAWATTQSSNMAELRRWIFTTADYENYLARVRRLLMEETEKVISTSELGQDKRDFFRLLVQATCWQESCFRQFKIRQRKLTFLLSYNQTSVGLMQINERVWRKLFNRNSLRWNIRYNARAGCQILERYLLRYALKDKEVREEWDEDLISRLCYALYNGGPGQYKKFLARHQEASYYKSDLLFWEKYNWAKLEWWDKVSRCLIGG